MGSYGMTQQQIVVYNIVPGLQLALTVQIRPPARGPEPKNQYVIRGARDWTGLSSLNSVRLYWYLHDCGLDRSATLSGQKYYIRSLRQDSWTGMPRAD